MYVYPILPISISETQMVVGFYCKKKERKLKLEKPFCLSYCIEETALITLLIHMMNISMLF